MPLTREELRACIHRAFDSVPAPDPTDILAADSQVFIDAIEMRVALAGIPWPQVPLRVVFRNREMLPELGAVGFRAYIPAYLLAALEPGTHVADIVEYTLFALLPVEERELDRTSVRTSLLDAAQRTAIEEWLRYFADDSYAKRALQAWIDGSARS